MDALKVMKRTNVFRKRSRYIPLFHNRKKTRAFALRRRRGFKRVADSLAAPLLVTCRVEFLPIYVTADSASSWDGAGSGADSASSWDGAGSGADSASSWDGAGSGADSASSWDGAGSGADSASSWDGAGSGADSASSWDGAGSGADSASSSDGAGSGADSASSRDGAGSGADSASSWDGAGSGADSASSCVAPTVQGEPLSCSAVSIYLSNVQLGSCSGMTERRGSDKPP